MAGISSRAFKSGSPENKRRYNGIEFESDLDLNTYDAFYRELDPQTGRWWQIDPKVDAGYESISPYVSMYDDPVRYSDPLGDEAEEAVVELEGSGDCCEVLRRALVSAGSTLNGMLNTATFGLWPAEGLVSTEHYTNEDKETVRTASTIGQIGGMLSVPGRGVRLGYLELAPVNGPKVSLPEIPFIVQTKASKGPKDLLGEAKAHRQKEMKAGERVATKKEASAKGNTKKGNSNKEVRGDHNTNKSSGNKNKHEEANARRAREQKAADSKKKNDY